VNADTRQSRFQGFLRSRVQHFVANRGRVGVPRQEHEFGSGPAVLRGEFEINESVAAVVLRKRLAKVFVGFGAFALGVNDNGFLVYNFVNIIAEFFALLQLEGVEGIGNLVVDCDTGGLKRVDRIE